MAQTFAEDVNYWRTSKSSPDTWIERTRRQIEKLGGKVVAEAFGSEPETNRAAFMLAFSLGNDQFRVVWPVLPSRTTSERAAKVQAATMLYHDIKARCISAAVLGTRAAFFSFLMLPDGRAAGEMSTPELAQAIPDLFATDTRPGTPMLEANVVLEGEFE